MGLEHASEEIQSFVEVETVSQNRSIIAESTKPERERGSKGG